MSDADQAVTIAMILLVVCIGFVANLFSLWLEKNECEREANVYECELIFVPMKGEGDE